MKESKHTPGPWIYSESTGTIRSVPANYWIASMDSFDGAVDNKANAILIANAPGIFEENTRLRAENEVLLKKLAVAGKEHDEMFAELEASKQEKNDEPMGL